MQDDAPVDDDIDDMAWQQNLDAWKQKRKLSTATLDVANAQPPATVVVHETMRAAAADHISSRIEQRRYK
jgi:hypothetical protein